MNALTNKEPIILLFGMPRSGTTWLGKIFDSHPDTLYRHEPDSVEYLQAPLAIDVADREEFDAAFKQFSRRLFETLSVRVNGKLPLFPKSYYSRSVFQTHRFITLAAKTLSAKVNNPKNPDLINIARASQLRLVWKSIESLGRFGAIARSVTPCYGVHIVRHPCGYVSSVLRGERQGKFDAEEKASEDYGVLRQLLDIPLAKSKGLSLEVLRGLEPVERLAWRWALVNTKAMEDTRGLDYCTTISYDGLCANPVETSQRLFSFCGLSWGAQTERFVGASTSAQGDAYYSVFKKPLEAARRWKKELREDDIERILAITRETPPGQLFKD